MEISDIEKQIKDIEDEIFNTKKNKATEHHIGKLKAKIARLRELAEKRKSTGTKSKGFSIKKSGDATVGLIGFPSIGKSTLLNKLTDAKSRIGDYDFTTLDAIPGMLEHKGAKIQIFDLPGLISGASEGKGRGREILSAIRNVDLILIMIDPDHQNHIELIVNELHNAGIRINQKKPEVVVKKTGQGGINYTATVKLNHLNETLIKSIASEYVINADIIIREDITEDQFIDSFLQNRVYVPAIIIVNKIDMINKKELQSRIKDITNKGWKTIAVSSVKGIGLENLKNMIFSELKFIRVFLKPVGKQADMNEPLILIKGDTVEDVCRKLHRDFKNKFRYATISGSSAKHDIQKVGLSHLVHDGDVITIVISK